MSRPAPAWLAEFQGRFSAVIRTPLDRAGGTLTAATATYDPHLCAEAQDGPWSRGAERLAVYNRQYWFRLFTVLQAAFPLTARLMGYWEFNGVAANYLLARPPRGWDIEAVSDGFRPYFEDSLDEAAPAPRLTWIECVRIDAAYREVFRAEAVPPLRPVESDMAALLSGQLVPLPASRLVEEHSALVALRTTLMAKASSAPVGLPPRLAQPQAWAIVRREAGTERVPLDLREAELLTLLGRHPVAEALARLESACPAEERADLPQKVRAWIARSIERGLWSELRRGG
jgi:hypothetical protein